MSKKATNTNTAPVPSQKSAAQGVTSQNSQQNRTPAQDQNTGNIPFDPFGANLRDEAADVPLGNIPPRKPGQAPYRAPAKKAPSQNKIPQQQPEAQPKPAPAERPAPEAVSAAPTSSVAHTQNNMPKSPNAVLNQAAPMQNQKNSMSHVTQSTPSSASATAPEQASAETPKATQEKTQNPPAGSSEKTDVVKSAANSPEQGTQVANNGEAKEGEKSEGGQEQNASGAVPPLTMPIAPAEVDFIPPLLRSISSLLRLRGKGVSPQFLYAGLAGVGDVTPGECLRSAARAGLRARILPRPTLQDISPMTLPCILLLENNRSCVLTALSHQVATVIFPELGEDPQQISQESLIKEYTGFAVFGAMDNPQDKRIDSFHRPKGKRWFWDAIKYYAPIYKHAAFASVIINLIALGSPLFVMNVYDRVVPNNALDTLWVLALGITIAYLFDFLLRTLRNHFVDTAGRNADVVISSMLVDKVLSMQLDHKPESTGALVNNVREFESLREFFSSSTLLSCIDLPFLFLFLLCLSFIGGPLVILPLVAMPIMFGAGILLQSMAKRAAEKSYTQSMHKNALLTEMVNGLETLKCCQGENRMQRMWETVVEDSAQANIETKKYGSLAVGFSVFVTQFITVGMVVWGVHLIAAGELTMGGLIGSNILAGRAMAPLMQMAGLITRYQNSRISLDALNMLMSIPSEDRQSQATVDFGPLEHSFTLEGVSFAYPGAARTAVEGLSISIEPGEKVGVIGRMGSGKSTLIRLLIGLYQPKDGAVKFGGVDIRQMAGAELRARVGFAPQDTVLFYGTVRDNITLGDPCINDQRMLRAAGLSGVSDFIRTNPEGFGAQVGEQGKALSGGQRQAIGLARALVRDPEVLILDEPTSNMDTSSEQAVQNRLMKNLHHKTLILVTHRMSMLKLVDRLVVMDSGRIVADGPKDEVIAKLRGTAPPPKEVPAEQKTA